MARPGYMSIYADERTQQIFDEFTRRRGVTKSTVLTEMLQIYMVSQDENLYYELLKESYNIEKAKQFIDQAEDASEINDYIFIKLGITFGKDGRELDGEETIQAYMTAIREKGHSWFSTMSLHAGMAKEKVKFYNDAIKSGKTVKLLFAIGMGINEVRYSATVEQIVSSRDEIVCPGDAKTVPEEFGEAETGKIWLDLSSINEEKMITAEMLKFRKDGGSVKAAITSSQFHFGYVYIDN